MDDFEDDFEGESGSSLRRKLEETLTRERQLTTELSGLKAKELITENGYGLVKVEDLVDVDLDQMSTKAEELQQERSGQQVDLARDVLAKRGLVGAELDKAVEDFLAPVGTGDVGAHTRTREVAAIGGTAAPLRETSGLMGLDAIDHALRTKQ
tara:strand:+ start:595 stop:1053 length:459 start_codon:yes stop_codon:yes gene_type:complete